MIGEPVGRECVTARPEPTRPPSKAVPGLNGKNTTTQYDVDARLPRTEWAARQLPDAECGRDCRSRRTGSPLWTICELKGKIPATLRGPSECPIVR